MIDDDDYESVGEDDYEDEDADVSAYEEDDADNEEAEDAVPDVPDLPQAAPPPRAPTRRCVQEPKPKRPWKPPSARRGKKRLEPDVSNDSSSSSDDAPPSPPSSSEEDAAHPDAEESPAEMGVDAEEAEKETRANKRRTAQRKRRAAASPAAAFYPFSLTAQMLPRKARWASCSIHTHVPENHYASTVLP